MNQLLLLLVAGVVLFVLFLVLFVISMLARALRGKSVL